MWHSFQSSLRGHLKKEPFKPFVYHFSLSLSFSFSFSFSLSLSFFLSFFLSFLRVTGHVELLSQRGPRGGPPVGHGRGQRLGRGHRVLRGPRRPPHLQRGTVSTSPSPPHHIRAQGHGLCCLLAVMNELQGAGCCLFLPVVMWQRTLRWGFLAALLCALPSLERRAATLMYKSFKEPLLSKTSLTQNHLYADSV